MRAANIVGFVLAGGEGRRLQPFTHELPKPALPFAGHFRLIDFALSNLYNSEFRSIYVLLQHEPEHLLGHIADQWAFANDGRKAFVEPVLSRDWRRGGGFRGTADAVRQSLDILDARRPDVVAVFAADHIYRMDVRQMLDFHLARSADATIAAVPVPIKAGSGLGIIRADRSGRVSAFKEKPHTPLPMRRNPRLCLASMGNYLFRAEALRAVLAESADRGEDDFGHHILPRLVGTHRVYAYDFSTNEIPGIRPHEHRGYWRDVGTVESYVAAHWDVLGIAPHFSLDNPQWPIYSGNRPTGVRSLYTRYVLHSIVAPGSSVDGASLRHTVVNRGAAIEPGATLEQCVIMNGVRIGRGVRLRRAIVGPNNAVESNAVIGHDHDNDRRRFTVTPAGIVVIPPRRGSSRPNTDSRP